MNAPLVVFDLDGTITRGDTFVAFLYDVLSQRPKRALYCLGLPWTFLQFKCGKVANHQIKKALLEAIVGGCRRVEVKRFGATFVSRRFAQMAKSQAIKRILWHREQGHRLVLATASLDLYATVIGDTLGFDQVIATRVTWHDDAIARDFEVVNLRGDAKLDEVKRALSRLDSRPSHIIAYSDHHSDLPLLRFADQAIIVDPTPQLEEAARIYGFSVERWHD